MTVIIIKHFIEFISPGSFISETSSKKVKSRNDSEVKIGDYCFGYRFYDRSEFSHPDTGEFLTGKPMNYSHWTYFGEVMTLAQVKKNVTDNRILVTNMINNGYKRVVKTKFQQYIPLEPKDKVKKTLQTKDSGENYD